ncbi:MAG TPA: hypothetical protein VE986_10340, partial [Hyphomicrobiales bacterium]|nr:hypothetical protein [Hyphomicrobiales bacterium]
EAPVIVGVGPNRIDLGDFVVSRVAEFEDRMRNYTPSNLARRWIDLASRGPEGDDADYVEALKSGKSVDLFAWGAALFERGLRTLAVGEEATIILTGGSSNWRWFSDHVSSKWPFAGRPSSVIFDSKPELTIARGLARVYAIGSYSGRLAGEIRAARKELMRPLRAIHRDILQKLAARLAIMIQSNEKLRGDLETILRSWAVKGFEPTASPGPAERLKHYFLSAAGNRFAEEIRLLIERCLKDWLVENQQEIRAASESFSQEAYRRVMALLRSRIRSEIGGLVEVAVEACGASGGARLDEALRGLGHNVKFEPNLALKLYGALAKVVSDAYSALMREEQPAIRGAFAAKDGDLVAAQTAKAMERLHLSLPGAIERNILAIQSSEAWSNQVIDHLLMTLRTLERLARGEHARSLVTQERRQ